MGKTRAAARQEKRRVRVGFTDMTFTLVVLLLLAMGIVMMFSASYAIAQNEDKPGYFYALRQVIFEKGLCNRRVSCGSHSADPRHVHRYRPGYGL